MKLRFEVDQADSFRRGVDRPKSIVSVEVNPADLSEDQRNCIAAHLDGIDVLQFFFHHGEVIKGFPIKELSYTARDPKRVVAKAANIESLVEAIKQNDQLIDQIWKSFDHPIQFRLIQKPPKDENEYTFVGTDHQIPGISEAIREGRKIWFECFINTVQTELNTLLQAHSYVVYLLPQPPDTASARFYCEPVFAAEFLNRQVVAHSPVIVYNEKTGRIVEVSNLLKAIDVYLINPGADVNDLSILSWEHGRWNIISPDSLIDIANESIWIKTRWKQSDLHHKRVDFQIPLSGGGVASGIGQFWVRQRPDGLLSVDIVTDTQGRDWAERIQTRFHLPQIEEGHIARHPDPNVADFLLK